MWLTKLRVLVQFFSLLKKTKNCDDTDPSSIGLDTMVNLKETIFYAKKVILWENLEGKKLLYQVTKSL